jgi:hypothetical protein
LEAGFQLPVAIFFMELLGRVDLLFPFFLLCLVCIDHQLFGITPAFKRKPLDPGLSHDGISAHDDCLGHVDRILFQITALLFANHGFFILSHLPDHRVLLAIQHVTGFHPGDSLPFTNDTIYEGLYFYNPARWNPDG